MSFMLSCLAQALAGVQGGGSREGRRGMQPKDPTDSSEDAVLSAGEVPRLGGWAAAACGPSCRAGGQAPGRGQLFGGWPATDGLLPWAPGCTGGAAGRALTWQLKAKSSEGSLPRLTARLPFSLSLSAIGLAPVDPISGGKTAARPPAALLIGCFRAAAEPGFAL